MGLMLPELLRADRTEAAADGAAQRSFGKAKSCIVCFMFGAPAHQDIWDLKPDAPSEVRGPFQPISSSVPGTMLSEHIPRIAGSAHRFALVRSVTHPDSTHTVAMHYMLSGVRHRRPNTNPTNLPDDFPCYGAAVNYVHRRTTALPAGISLNSPGNEIPSGHIFPGFFAGFIGQQYDPMFVTDNPAQAEFDPFPQSRSVSPIRSDQRQSLLGRLDQLRRRLDTVDAIRGAAEYQDAALGLINSPHAASAFQLRHEKPSLRQSYGMSPFGQGCLVARRLVEAGVRLVTVNWARDYQAVVADHWDTHRQNFVLHKDRLLPAFDVGYTALLDDLQQRGMLDETLVVVLGEFGRTPKINKDAGRDHWPGCFAVTFAGAGIQCGVVHGASDSIAAYPSRDPVGPEDVAATIYHCLGIPADTELVDLAGRPFPLATGQPIWDVIA